MAANKNAQLRTGVGKPKHAWTTDKTPKLTDCYGVLERSAWIWRIMGIFPFVIKGPIGVKKYNVSAYYAVYSVLISSVCIGNCGRWMIEYDWSSSISMASISVMIRTFSSMLCIMVASMWRIFRHKEMADIIDTINDQNLILEKMNCCLQYETNAKIICTYVWTMSMTVVLLMAYDFYASFTAYDSLMLQWPCWIIPLIAQVLDLTIFVSLAGLLGLKLRALNKKLSTVVMRANSSLPKVIVNSDICADNLRRIAKAHFNICAVGKRINNFFSVDVVINVITAFVILSTTLYYIFVEVQREGKTNYIRIGTYIHWEFIHSVPIIIIVAVCNWTSNQSIHTGKLIHEIRVKKIDSRLYEAVKAFSLQLHHQKLEFSGGGFFPVNSTLIQSMVGNITTYLVILIQFQPKLD